MSHILVLYAPDDQEFARHLAVQIEQRGLVVWPVPDPTQPPVVPPPPDPGQGAAGVSHVIVVLSQSALAVPDGATPHWAGVADRTKHIIVVTCDDCAVPDDLRRYPAVQFKGQFLLAVEEVVRWLTKMDAPTRPLTVEHPPPVVKPDLLPTTLPSERCWREDRLRINYNLPIILTGEELELRMPAFLVAFDFELVKSSPKQVRGRRLRRYAWFDPRRAEHTITVRRRRDGLKVYYRMTRTQVYHWFPAHYRVLDREAAALYRYLVTGKLDDHLHEPVNYQGRVARAVSWGAIALFWLVVIALIYLVAI